MSWSVSATVAPRSWSGVVQNSRSGIVQALIDADVAISTPVPLTVRVGVCSTDGGVGASTVAGGLGTLFAARRRGAALLVAASGNADAMHSAGLHQVEERSFLQFSVRRNTPQRLADAMHGLPVTEQGLHCLDLSAQTSAIATPTVSQCVETLSPMVRYLDLVCTDFGRRARTETSELAAFSHVIVVTCRADRDSLDRAVAVVDDLRAEGHHVVVCVSDLSGQMAPSALDVVTQDWALPVFLLPRDRALARPNRDRREVGLDRLAPKYQRQLISLAAAVMTQTRREVSA